MQYKNKETLRQLYLAADEDEYNDIYEKQIVYMNASEQEKMAKFNNLSSTCCISKIPKTFVALGCSTSMSEKINDLFKTVIPRETNFSQVFVKLANKADKINEMQPLIRIETYNFESVFKIPEIRDIRLKLNKSTFQRFIREVSKAVTIDYNECYKMCMMKEDSSKWQCQCEFQDKTGLPCKHIIKTIICNGYSLLRQIDNYWIIPSKEEVEKKRTMMIQMGRRFTSMGKGKNSRRNLKK